MLKLEIVTPVRKLLTAECESVVLPGSEGELEVLEGHTPVLASLKTGMVTIKRPRIIEKPDDESFPDGVDLQLMVAPGFAEVGHAHVAVMCDAAALPGEIDATTEQGFNDTAERKRLDAEIERSTVHLS